MFALAAIFFTSACEPEVPSRAEVIGGDGVRVPTLVNGTAYSGRASVGELRQSGQLSCTATLVGKQTVLTAAHCIQQGASYTFVVGGQTYQVSSVVVHPSYGPQNQIGDDDIAVLRLSSAPSVAPASLAQSAPTVGLGAVLVGYGRTSAMANDSGVRRGATASIGVVQAKRIGLLDPSKGLTCNGDSGGPMFATLGGKEYVVGVVSGATQPGCGIDSYYARVDVYLQWIQTTAQNDVSLAGATPEPLPKNAPGQPGQPGQPTPPGGQPPLSPPGGQPPLTPPGGQPPTTPGQGAFGAQCQSGSQCQSSVCAVDQLGAGFCSTLCSSQQDCPGSPCYPTMQGLGVCGLSGAQPYPPNQPGQPYPPNQPGQPYPPNQPGQPYPPNQPGQPYPPGGGGQLGTPCQSTQQCVGGICVAGSNGSGVCTTVCAGGSGGFGGSGWGGSGWGGGGGGWGGGGSGSGFGGYGNGFSGFGCPAGSQCVPTNVPGLSVCM